MIPHESTQFDCAIAELMPHCAHNPTKECACKPENLDAADTAARTCVRERSALTRSPVGFRVPPLHLRSID